jgi:hypothetical protein
MMLWKRQSEKHMEMKLGHKTRVSIYNSMIDCLPLIYIAQMEYRGLAVDEYLKAANNAKNIL